MSPFMRTSTEFKLLIAELDALRRQLELNDCPHTHLFSPVSGGSELTTTKLATQAIEANVVHHVKIYGWIKEWATRHGLTSTKAE